MVGIKFLKHEFLMFSFYKKMVFRSLFLKIKNEFGLVCHFLLIVQFLGFSSSVIIFLESHGLPPSITNERILSSNNFENWFLSIREIVDCVFFSFRFHVSSVIGNVFFKLLPLIHDGENLTVVDSRNCYYDFRFDQFRCPTVPAVLNTLCSSQNLMLRITQAVLRQHPLRTHSTPSWWRSIFGDPATCVRTGGTTTKSHTSPGEGVVTLGG